MTIDAGDEHKDALVVLGMHRSGTSALSRLLSLAGAQLPAALMGAGDANPDGHWEPQDVADLNDRILADLDSDWSDAFGPKGIRTRPLPKKRYVADAADIIRRNYDNAGLIVLKEPRASLFVDLWHEALKRENYAPAYIISVRHPSEVAASLKARDGFVPNRSLFLWASYMIACELKTRHYNRVFVKYDDLIVDPEATLDRIERSVGVTFPRRTWNSTLDIQEFVKAERRHHDVARGTPATAGFNEIEKFYEYLDAACRDEPWNVDVANETAAWLDKVEQQVGPMLKQIERERRNAQRARDEEEGRLNEVRQALEAREAREAELEQSARRAAEESAAHIAALDEAVAASQRDQAQRESDLSASIADLAARAEAAELRSAALDDALTAQQGRLVQREAELSESIAALTARAEAAESRSAALDDALTAQQGRLVQREAEHSESIAALTARAEAAESRSAALDDALTAQQGRLVQREAEFSAIVAELADRAEAAETSRAVLEDALAAQRDRLDQREAEFAAKIAEVRADAEAAEARCVALDDALEVKLAQVVDLNEAIAEARRVQDQREVELGEVRASLRAQTRALEAMETALSMANEHRFERETELARRLTALQERADAAESRSAALDHELSQVRDHLEHREHELQERVVGAISEIEALEAKSGELARILSGVVKERDRLAGRTGFQLQLEALRRLLGRGKR